MKFLDLMESDTNTKNKSQCNSPLTSLLHHFGKFFAHIDDARPDSEMYIDVLANTKEPEELLQLGLDFVRCIFELNPIGTWLLNGNPDFLDDVIRGDIDSISYSSSFLNSDNDFGNHINEITIPSLELQNYDPSNKHSIYTIITTHSNNLNTKFVEKVSSVITDVFGDNDNVIHIGYCRDGALADSSRVSVMVAG